MDEGLGGGGEGGGGGLRELLRPFAFGILAVSCLICAV